MGNEMWWINSIDVSCYWAGKDDDVLDVSYKNIRV